MNQESFTCECGNVIDDPEIGYDVIQCYRCRGYFCTDCVNDMTGDWLCSACADE